MILASDLDALLKVLNERGVNMFRYKAPGGEEMEVVIPGDVSTVDVNDNTKNSPPGPHIKLIGFKHDEDSDSEIVTDD